jgi:lipopolysaccharide transport system permease protein
MDHKQYQIIIESGQTEKNYWKDLWRFCELFYILNWRDIKVKYKQATLGILWAIIRPLLTMIVFTIVFGRLAHMKVEGTATYAIAFFLYLSVFNLERWKGILPI